jgi:1,2-diacylglycerol 3-alpha-glucosyltransferase
MKIALFTDTFEEGYGGITVYVRTLTDFLINQGHEVKVFVWESDNLTSEDYAKCYTFRSFDVVNKVRGKAGFAPIKMLFIVKKFNPDIMHNHSQYTMGLHAILISKTLKIPLINHYHMYLEKTIDYFPKIFQKTKNFTSYAISTNTKISFNSADLVITPSQVMKDYLLMIGVLSSIEVIPFGINLSQFNLKRQNNDIFTFIHVGRLNSEKNIVRLVEIFYEFSIDKNVKLKIIGDGPEKNKITSFIEKNRVHDKIELYNWMKRENLPIEYVNSDCFITLSDSETFGIVILEAMASGLPIIGANEAAIPNLIKNDYNGFLVDIHDKNEIINCMNILYKNEELKKAFSNNSKNMAKKYEERKVFKQLEQLYFKLVEKTKK